MKCEGINELLSAFLDKEVTPDERKQIEAHLLTCEKCREESRMLASVRERLRQALKARSVGVEPSAQVWDRIKQRISTNPHFWDHFSDILNSPTWRRAIPVTLVVVAVGVLWGTGVLPRLVGFESAVQESVPTPPVITFAPGSSDSASWATNYEDMGELCSLSDVIVVGTVDRVIEVVPAEWGHGRIYDARSAFRIDKVLKGEIGKEIVLTYMALAGSDGWVEGMAEDPPLEAGERWVFFLRVDSLGSYHNLGPWGRYKIIDGKVYSMNRLVASYNAYGEGELDFNGVDLPDFIAGVNETLDSVVLTFTDSYSLPDHVLRFDAGGYQTVIINLSTGTYGPDDLTYTIKRVESKDSAVEMPMPAELNVTIEPAQFTAYPRNKYQSTLKIQTDSNLSPGTYWIRVEYQLGESVSGFRVLMVNINPLETVGAD